MLLFGVGLLCIVWFWFVVYCLVLVCCVLFVIALLCIVCHWLVVYCLSLVGCFSLLFGCWRCLFVLGLFLRFFAGSLVTVLLVVCVIVCSFCRCFVFCLHNSKTTKQQATSNKTTSWLGRSVSVFVWSPFVVVLGGGGH